LFTNQLFVKNSFYMTIINDKYKIFAPFVHYNVFE